MECGAQRMACERRALSAVSASVLRPSTHDTGSVTPHSLLTADANWTAARLSPPSCAKVAPSLPARPSPLRPSVSAAACHTHTLRSGSMATRHLCMRTARKSLQALSPLARTEGSG